TSQGAPPPPARGRPPPPPPPPPPTAPPAAPASLSAASGPGARKITLKWSSAAGAASYTIARSQSSGGPYATVASGVTGTSYQNTGLTSGTMYFYVVNAVNSAGVSPSSPRASAKPKEAVVTRRLGAPRLGDHRLHEALEPVVHGRQRVRVVGGAVPKRHVADVVEGDPCLVAFTPHQNLERHVEADRSPLLD